MAMKRRTALLGALALAGAGTGLLVSRWNPFSVFGTGERCSFLKLAWRARSTADYQARRTTLVDGWVLSESEAELLTLLRGGDGESTQECRLDSH